MDTYISSSLLQNELPTFITRSDALLSFRIWILIINLCSGEASFIQKAKQEQPRQQNINNNTNMLQSKSKEQLLRDNLFFSMLAPVSQRLTLFYWTM